MNTKVVAHQYKLQQWTSLIQECRSSGMKVKDWCQQNQISKDTYYYWFREVRKAACVALEGKSVSEPCFVPVPSKIVEAPVSPSEMKISIGNATVEVNGSTSPEILRMVLEVLANA